MYIPLETLAEQIGRSIQAAQVRLEQEAADTFFRGFQTVDQPSGSQEVPLTRRVGLPGGGPGEMRTVDVPVAALVRHQSMALDCVTVRLPVMTQVRSADNALLVEPCPAGREDGAEEAADAGQMEFVFRSSPPAEGIARLDLGLQKTL